MKPRHPNVEWIKKILADLERDRGNPQIAALMDRELAEHRTGEPAGISVRRIQRLHEPLDRAPAPFKP